MQKINTVPKFVNQHQNKKIIFILALVILYAILCRLIAKELFAVLVVSTSFAFAVSHFYLYVNKYSKAQNVVENKTEYSWGYTKENRDNLDFLNFIKVVNKLEWSFYKKYISIHLDKIIIIAFIFADLIVAFKNLSLIDAGSFFALSIFTKIVFLSYFYIADIYANIDDTNKEMEEKVLDVFYRHINGVISVFFVLFILVFILSKYIIEILFGEKYLPLHSSLPYILLANMFLCIALIVYITAKKINSTTTKNILRIFVIVFTSVFIFMGINYIDTVTYFIVGTSALLSIFLYNFSVKKMDYISNTYSHLF